MNDSYGQRRSYVSGAPTEAFLNQIDQARGTSPFHNTRGYNGQGVDGTPQPRRDLVLDPATLQARHDVPLEDLTFIADAMRYGDIAHIPFSVGLIATDAPILTRPQTKRTYLLIQNTHATQTLFIGFGIKPSSANGILLLAGGNLLMDAFVGQNDIWLAGSGAATTGILSYCNATFTKG